MEPVQGSAAFVLAFCLCMWQPSMLQLQRSFVGRTLDLAEVKSQLSTVWWIVPCGLLMVASCR